MTQTPLTTTSSPTGHNTLHNASVSLMALVVIVVAVFPGALVGMLFVAAVWSLTRPPLAFRFVVSVACLAAFLGLRQSLLPGWDIQLLATALGLQPVPPDIAVVAHSALVEAALAPSLLVLVATSNHLWRNTFAGQARTVWDEMTRRAKALQPGWKGPSGPASPGGEVLDHPGKIRLGHDEARRVYDLDTSELMQHVFLPGASGTGKTTTLVRLAHGALRNGFSVAIVDCKGAALGRDAKRIAKKFDLPFYLVDPAEPKTLGYDPCTGDPFHIANKLIGAFSFGPAAEIYKNVAMEVVPVISRAIESSGEHVTINAIYDALGTGGLLRLARKTPAGAIRDRLHELAEVGGVGKSGYEGIQRRLGALMEGRFGPLFENPTPFDWSWAATEPSVTYLSLSATAAGEDVELFARVIIQDLKQLCDVRLRDWSGVPLLVVFDEFAALRESEQIVDLLLQARQARMPIVIATQYIPIDERIRLPALQSGVIIAHRLGHDDAEQIANEMGTRKVPFVTSQIDYETGISEKGSVRMVDEYIIHPNVLRSLPVGKTAVYSRPTDRRSLVHIQKDP